MTHEEQVKYELANIQTDLVASSTRGGAGKVANTVATITWSTRPLSPAVLIPFTLPTYESHDV